MFGAAVMTEQMRGVLFFLHNAQLFVVVMAVTGAVWMGASQVLAWVG